MEDNGRVREGDIQNVEYKYVSCRKGLFLLGPLDALFSPRSVLWVLLRSSHSTSDATHRNGKFGCITQLSVAGVS